VGRKKSVSGDKSRYVSVHGQEASPRTAGQNDAHQGENQNGCIRQRRDPVTSRVPVGPATVRRVRTRTPEGQEFLHRQDGEPAGRFSPVYEQERDDRYEDEQCLRVFVDRAVSAGIRRPGVIRRTSLAAAVTIFSGTAARPGVNDGTGNAASFDAPAGVAADAFGNLYVADSSNNTVRRAAVTGAVTTSPGLLERPARATVPVVPRSSTLRRSGRRWRGKYLRGRYRQQHDPQAHRLRGRDDTGRDRGSQRLNQRRRERGTVQFPARTRDRRRGQRLYCGYVQLCHPQDDRHGPG
jgi:hypothetical protein